MEHSSRSSLIEEIFTSKIERRFFAWYRRFFSIEEVENNKTLQWGFGVLLLTFLVSFYAWANNPNVAVTSYLINRFQCWPYFQDCGRWFFIEALPNGYSQPILYSAFFAIMLAVAYLISKKEWVLAHLGLSVLWLWKFLLVFVLTSSFAGNFDKYDVVLGTALLFFPHKLFFVRFFFVYFYFLASTIKIHEGWFLGTYFTSLKTGLPIFPDAIAPIITNLVIFMQMVGSWFLFSENKKLQRGALVYFLLFHLYSIILVAYRYPVTAITTLLVYFGIDFRPTPVPIDRRSIAGWLFAIVLFVAQFIGIFIPGDQKLTLEGNMYGLYMFEANHQCVSQTDVQYTDGRIVHYRKEHANARDRCAPYDTWFRIHQLCLRHPKEIASVQWTFDHSINGGPFYRIVNEENACSLVYKPFSHNEWIKIEKDNPAIVGYPVENFYR